MDLYTAWKMVRDRLAGSQQETPKKRRQPRQPKAQQSQQLSIDDAEIDARINARIEEAFRGVNFTLTTQHSRISELEQIEHRRREENQGG